MILFLLMLLDGTNYIKKNFYKSSSFQSPVVKNVQDLLVLSKKFQYKKENKIRMRNTGENQSPALETIKQN